MAESERKAELITELAGARERVTGNYLALRKGLDFSARAKRAFSRSPAVWIGGTALAGLILARLFSRPKKVVVSRKVRAEEEDGPVAKAGKMGLVFALVKIALTLARPTLTRWATQRFSAYAATRQWTGFSPH